jgi:hypothetical protein
MFQVGRTRFLWSPTQVSTTIVWWWVRTMNDCMGKTRPFEAVSIAQPDRRWR